MYQFIDRLQTLYGLLQDEQSKEIFQARFDLDMEPSIPNIQRLVLLGNCRGFLGGAHPKIEALRELDQEHKKIILYGAGSTGRLIAQILESEHINFYGFCGRRAERYPDGLLGKPVLSPDELVAHGDEYYVIITAAAEDTYTEISTFLQKHSYPAEHLLDWFGQAPPWEQTYFEFPALYRRGTAFIDGGCFNCATSRRFAEWCGNAYSSIIAFEPDPDNYAECRKNIQNIPLPNFQLINAGLSSRAGTAEFDARGSESSRIISAGSDSSKEKISIRTVAIDDIVGAHTVGFIKMDIEGAEFDALHGAKSTITRDKPLLAICVYHFRGDTFAIMDYLHQLVPEYRFLLRHYSVSTTETVLYASVDL